MAAYSQERNVDLPQCGGSVDLCSAYQSLGIGRDRSVAGLLDDALHHVRFVVREEESFAKARRRPTCEGILDSGIRVGLEGIEEGSAKR